MFVVTLGAGLTVLWAGWTGQMRLAFAALTGVIIAVLAARQVAPFIAKRAGANTDVVTRERPYEATRAGYTRRAFAVDRIGVADSTIGFTSLTQAAAYVSLWDDATLRRSTERAQAGATLSWQAVDSALVATVAPADAANAPSAFLAGSVDDAGLPVRVPRAESAAARPPIVVVADSLAKPMVVVDSTGRLAAPPLNSAFTRFAYALAMQDVRVWLARPAAAAHMVERRTVRERVAAMAPFFAQGSTIAPLWIADTLGWALDVYATSETYPLSRRLVAAGAERAYWQHAATAIVNAASGRVVFVADSAPDPVTATWIARFPKLFTRPTALRVGVKEQFPPAIDGARAQAAAFGRYGMRGETDVVRHLPDDEGPDSALVGLAPPAIALPRSDVAAVLLPLLDRTERVRGLFIAFGGPSHRSLWLPAREPAPIWSETLDRLRASDTTSAALARGYARIFPVGNRLVTLQPRFDMRASGPPRLLYVTAAIGDTIRTARSMFQLGGRTQATTPISNADFRARVQELYNEMRRASTRGDWGRYGRAFDDLGVLLRQPRR
jgi:hypothetical protein